MSEPVVQRQAVPDPQEALREQIEAALLAALCPTHCGYRISSGGMWIDAEGHQHSEFKQGGPCWVHVNLSRRLADAVLPVVQAHTQALRAEHAHTWTEHPPGTIGGQSVWTCECGLYSIGGDLSWAPMYATSNVTARAHERRAAQASADLAALRDAVSRLADELQKDAAHARKRQSDPPDALALHRFLGDERTYLHAAHRLRSLLGDKENN